MNRDDLPTYDATEQGIDSDYHQRSTDYQNRTARSARYKGGVGALAQRLNSDRTIDGVFKPKAPVPENSNAVIYLRVSSEEQAKKGGTAEGYSIPYQRDACRAKAASMGLVVVDEYVDAGQSAKSARRPRLQAMLRELEAKQVRYVIVHKIDRLARNKRDDFLINEAIAEAGACLVSVVDLVDDTPQGKFNYTIQAGLAQLYVDNLAVEVMKGMNKKADAGGTPYRAPIGYLNKRRIEGVADIRWVEKDPDRWRLITWAFEEYATGEWSLSQLRDALTDKGLTTRPTPKRAAQAISLNGLHKILTNPYYAGLLPWQGAYYEGAHQALIDVDTWLRVQDVLRAHDTSGEKHPNPPPLPQRQHLLQHLR
jgi:site-specific DNA recombinase